MSAIIGVRHADDCLCGCQHVVGLEGEVVERSCGWSIATFVVPCPAGGKPAAWRVAYSSEERR